MPNPQFLPQRVLITGATGLVGKALVARLQREFPSMQLRALTRNPERTDMPGVTLFGWDPNSGRLDEAALDGLDGLFHLAGETVAQRWTSAARDRIRSSRIDSLDLLRASCEKRGLAPRIASASAIGWYPDSPHAMIESAPAGEGFIADIVQGWELAAHRFGALGGGHVSLRIGLVLSPNGGVLSKLLPVYRAGLGAPLAPGTQWQSWIHLDDLAALFIHSMTHSAWQGSYNAVSPQPVTQRAFSQALADTLNRPHFLPAVPRLALRIAYGKAANALLASNRIVPDRTTTSGFEFQHVELRPALASLLC